ncbi:MAG TPA: hypothetical protein DCS42_05670 [Nitrospiraceae bacterium]|nr:hypothetical protein [Nitrospiraceae bacterium]
MKIKPFIFSVLFLLWPALIHAEGLGGIHISHLEGDVQVMSEDSGEWIPASLNMPLQEGDRLWVPEEGRAEVQFQTGTFVRLDEESVLDILRVDGSSAQFYLAQGRAYLNFWNVTEGFLQIDTPLASVTIATRSILMVDVADNGGTELSVLKGLIETDSRNGMTTVTAGKKLIVRDTGYTDLSSLGRSDRWEEWNRQRDARLAQEGESTRYLPAELRSYAGDMDAGGRWIYVEGYDYVWTPTVIFASDWAPYRVGRWAWIGTDYVWVSYEPWGWVPYHYGRWAFVARIGWCWVPPLRGAVYWGPGYVSWVHTSAYAAWAPLAPGEIYYGYGYYGPLSVNITQVNIYNVRKQAIHKNIHVHNAVTVIDRDTFIHGKGRKIYVKQNPFLEKRSDYGRPQWKREKVTRFPVIKEVPQRRIPPQRLRQIPLKEVRQERPFLKERPHSAFGSEDRKKSLREAQEPQKKTWAAPPARPDTPARQTPAQPKQYERKRGLGEAMQEQEAPRPERDYRERPQPAQPGTTRTPGNFSREKLKQPGQYEQHEGKQGLGEALKEREAPREERGLKERQQPVQPMPQTKNKPTQPGLRQYRPDRGSESARQPAQPMPLLKSKPDQPEKRLPAQRPPQIQKEEEKKLREQQEQQEQEKRERGNGDRPDKEDKPGKKRLF